jgi:hypothetical protein
MDHAFAPEEPEEMLGRLNLVESSPPLHLLHGERHFTRKSAALRGIIPVEHNSVPGEELHI